MDSEPTQFLDLLTALNRTSRQLISEAYSAQVQLGESAAVLLKRLSVGTADQVTQAQLAREMCLSESSLCSLIERLRKERYLHRERLIADRRKTRIALTAEGSAAVEKILLTDLEVEEEIQRQLHGQEIDEVMRMLHSVYLACKELQSENGAPRRAA